MRIDLPGWRGSTGDIPPMAGLYWRIYYQIENPRIGELQWRRNTMYVRAEMEIFYHDITVKC